MTPGRVHRRRRIAWLLVPLLVLAACGGRICWCHGPGDDHHASAEAAGDQLAGSGHDVDGAEHDGHRKHPVHDHGAPGSGCQCVGADTPALEIAGSADLVTLHAIAVGVSYAMPGPAPSRVDSTLAWAARAQAPPLFVLNCTYRC